MSSASSRIVTSSPHPMLTILEQIDHGIGQIIDMQEFAPWRARAPDGQSLIPAQLGFVKTPDQGR
jgi:hypothetical protein